jgi:hypothetical protein
VPGLLKGMNASFCDTVLDASRTVSRCAAQARSDVWAHVIKEWAPSDLIFGETPSVWSSKYSGISFGG